MDNNAIRSDLTLTSTGIGHDYKEPLNFPPLNFKRNVTKPLPPIFQNNRNVRDFYITTSGFAHQNKPRHASISNDLYKKAPGHWKVHYTEDTITKLQEKPQRKALTMGNQDSEMKSQFTGRGVMSLNPSYSNDVQPQIFRHHHTDGPLKTLVPSTVGSMLPSNTRHPIHDRGVFDYHGEMYLTTTQKDHRPFTKEELEHYPKKHFATYWECEGYPKAWGHGSKNNPLPPDSVPREKGPMRDTLVFKNPVAIRRMPKAMQPVPNTGMCSEVTANFKAVSPEKNKELFDCPVPKPWQIDGSSSDGIFTVPKMYNTEYQTIGSGDLITV